MISGTVLMTMSIAFVAAGVAGSAVAQDGPPPMLERLRAAGRTTRPFAMRTIIDVRSDAAERFIVLARENSAATNGKERPISFRFYQDAERPTRFVLFQEWENADGFGQHLRRPHAVAFEEAIRPLLDAEPERRVYRFSNEPADGDGRADRAAVDAQRAAAPTAEATGKRLAAQGMAESPFVLFVDIPVREGGAATLKDTAGLVVPPTLAEPGSVKYGYYQDIDRPGRFLLFEHWRRFADMAAHVELPHFRRLMKTFALVGGDGRQVGVYRPLSF